MVMQQLVQRRESLSISNPLTKLHTRTCSILSCFSLSDRFAAAAGTAWYGRQTIVDTATNSQLWVTSHLEFVGVLFKSTDMRERLEELLDLEENNVQFYW